jgi:hypothetical protein
MYVNSTMGISIEYPVDWKIDESPLDRIIIDSPYDSSSRIIIESISNFMTQDPVVFLETTFVTNSESNSFEFINLPEPTRIGSYQGARLIATTKYPNFTGPVLDVAGTPLPTTMPSTYDVPLELLTVADGDRAMLIIVEWPNKDTENILQTLSFTP